MGNNLSEFGKRYGNTASSDVVMPDGVTIKEYVFSPWDPRTGLGKVVYEIAPDKPVIHADFVLGEGEKLALEAARKRCTAKYVEEFARF